MLKQLLALALLIPFAACTHEVKKPEKQWKVSTSTDSEKRVWVTRADGSRQCEKQKTAGPDEVARQVQGAGLMVFQARAGRDGRMVVQRCGAPTGRTVELEIPYPDLRKALALGFTTKE